MQFTVHMPACAVHASGKDRCTVTISESWLICNAYTKLLEHVLSCFGVNVHGKRLYQLDKHKMVVKHVHKCVRLNACSSIFSLYKLQ